MNIGHRRTLALDSNDITMSITDQGKPQIKEQILSLRHFRLHFELVLCALNEPILHFILMNHFGSDF